MANDDVTRHAQTETIVRLLEENNRILRNIDERLRKITFNTNGK